MIPIPAPRTQASLRFWYKALRKRLAAKLPFVKRKRHRQLNIRHEQLLDTFLALPQPAVETPHTFIAPLRQTQVTELCLFVTHAKEPVLKTHVIDHVEALLKADIAVILIINSDHAPERIQFPDKFIAKLHGCLARANVGYDFGAWAQTFCLLNLEQIQQRLYLINDSIVGPLDAAIYEKLIARIRNTDVDLLGMTANGWNTPHLQSFFLALNPTLIRSTAMQNFMRGVVNFTDKQNVIDIYETRLSAYLKSRGFRCKALFPRLAPDAFRSDDTLFNWARLIKQGFPFIKASVLSIVSQSTEAKSLVPARYRSATGNSQNTKACLKVGVDTESAESRSDSKWRKN